jgi:hypothetical protein
MGRFARVLIEIWTEVRLSLIAEFIVWHFSDHHSFLMTRSAVVTADIRTESRPEASATPRMRKE